MALIAVTLLAFALDFSVLCVCGESGKIKVLYAQENGHDCFVARYSHFNVSFIHDSFLLL